jgi:hypothetical protein
VDDGAVTPPGPNPGRGGPAAERARRARLARRQSRGRFGIETSYRQLNQGRGTTTAKDADCRLLLVGLALLLRQAWVWLTAQLARCGRLGRAAWVGELPLPKLLDWLARALRRRHRERLVIELGQPLTVPDGLQL